MPTKPCSRNMRARTLSSQAFQSTSSLARAGLSRRPGVPPCGTSACLWTSCAAQVDPSIRNQRGSASSVAFEERCDCCHVHHQLLHGRANFASSRPMTLTVDDDLGELKVSGVPDLAILEDRLDDYSGCCTLLPCPACPGTAPLFGAPPLLCTVCMSVHASFESCKCHWHCQCCARRYQRQSCGCCQ